MPNLSISLLGPPLISLNGDPVKIPTSRAVPLLAYLAIGGQPQSREILASLLWTDSSQKQALAALRTTLWRLKSAGLEEWIALERNKIALNHTINIDIDVVNFKAFIDRCNEHGHPPSQICLFCTPSLTRAIELYRGEFMKGFNISKALTFDDWRMQQSETLESLYLNAIERLVRCHRTFGDFNLAIQYARLWLSADQLNENAHSQLLQLYSITGQRTAAITQYKHYKELLSRELGVEPTEEIAALYQQIVRGHSTPVVRHRVNSPVFLIADIEKATLFWARTGENKDHILAIYTNLFKETARRFGGIILQKTEDNITLLFENGQPLHCAVTLHLMLKKANWGNSDPPNIRMVLYSTIKEENSPGNFAMLTRMASLLLSISWGGQVIFTDQTLRLLDIPSGSNIKDLGLHFLHDSEEPAHVYELLHPHLPPVEHPHLLSINQQLYNFPNLDPPFIGRETELEALHSLIGSPDVRLISLVGPGGVGKTHLAVKFASQIVEAFPDGIYFISLSSIQDPDFMPILFADILNFSFYGPTNQIEQLAKYLHRMQVLLVIDNFEHLRSEGAKILALLLANTHSMKILVTSRERLNLIAETVIDVHGLPVPTSSLVDEAESYSSIKLFLHNAERIFPKFSYHNNSESVVEICQLVNGIPLGILLASSWVRVFSCAEISSEIKQSIDFLTTNAPDIDPRHRSLRAVFDNSWRLLSNEERSLLRKLSIFHTSFTKIAAREICAATPLLLSVCTDKSLINKRPDGRFEMLATFNQYASGKLQEVDEELIVIRDKFCEYYADFCAKKQIELNTPIQRSALIEMISEIENIRIAWSWMVDSDRWDLIDKCKRPLQAYHIILGNYIQGREFFHLALQKLNRLNTPDLDLIRASMHQLSSWMTYRIGFMNEGVRGLSESLEDFRFHNATWDIAITLFYLADAYINMGNPLQAKKSLEEALLLMRSDEISQTNYVTSIIAHCQSLLGVAILSLGDDEQARLNFNTSLATHLRIGTHYGSIQPLMGLGRLAFHHGEFLQARVLYLQALEKATNIYDHRGMALIHNNLSAINEVLVNTAESIHHVLTALQMIKETGDRRMTALILNNLAYQQLRFLNQPAEAIRTYQECLEIFSDLGDLRGITYTSYDVSKAYLKVGLLDEAWSYCAQALNTSMTLDSIPLVLHALHGFANLFANLQQTERALRLCYLIELHPQIETDTRMRAIVTRCILEASLQLDEIASARSWGGSVNLQDVIDQILKEKQFRIA
jgi:predicted ATPase/DNA-binding SARP family transcriptional activator